MYKISNYNVFVRQDDRMLYFNTMHQTSFIMQPNEHRRIEAQWQDPIEFELAFPSTCQQFVDWGFLVEDGVEELGAIRHRHMCEVYDKSKIHMLINLSGYEDKMIAKNEQIDVIDKLETHILARISDPQTNELCIEWYAHNDKCYQNIITRINKFAKNECQTVDVTFLSQINLKALKINAESITGLASQGINAIWADVSLIGKAKIKPSENTDPRILTKFIENLESIIKINPQIHVVLNLYIKKGTKNRQVDNIITSIPSHAQDNISANIFTVSSDGAVNSEQPTLISTISPEMQWQRMNESKMSNYSLDTEGQIYFGRHVTPDPCRNIGHLDDKGNIEYMITKQGHYYGLTWFENERCTKCKYLPLFMDICSMKVIHQGNARNIACPIADGSIKPDIVIAKFFENKQNQ